MNRRGFIGAVLGAIATPVFARLPAPTVPETFIGVDLAAADGDYLVMYLWSMQQAAVSQAHAAADAFQKISSSPTPGLIGASTTTRRYPCEDQEHHQEGRKGESFHHRQDDSQGLTEGTALDRLPAAEEPDAGRELLAQSEEEAAHKNAGGQRSRPLFPRAA